MNIVFPVVRERHTDDVFDVEGLRGVICAEVRSDVRLRGDPRPRILAYGDGVRYEVDLADLTRRDPGASIALTAAALAALPEAHRVFLVVGLLAAAGDHPAALVVERVEVGPGWSATLAFRRAASGVGDPDGDWASGAGLPADLEAALLRVEPGARAAALAAPRPREPDIRAAFGELPGHLPLPADALQQAELTAAMVTPEALRDGLEGVVVLRLDGRSWEWWVLGEGMPTDLDDMVRVICARGAVPDGVAVVQLSRLEGPGVDGVGLQIVAERAGGRAERWVLLDFPEGPGGPRVVQKLLARTLPAPAEGEGWIGVAPEVDFDLAALG